MRALSRLIVALLVVMALPALGQGYPARPVRLVVPWPPGGTLDIVGRLLAKEMQERWSQSVVVDNRPGASGNIGVENVAKSAADGYSIVLVAPPQVSTPYLQKLGYDIERDLVPLVQTAIIEYVLAASPGSGITSLDGLIARAKAAPGKINFASAGIGSGQHLQVELLKAAAGMDLVHVPYKGSAPAIAALLAGEVQLFFDTSVGIIPLVQSGKVRPLLATGAKPLDALPGVPAMSALYPETAIEAWHGIMAPAGTPRAIADKLIADLRAIVQSPNVAGKFRELGFQPTGTPGEAFGAIIRRDLERWGKVIRDNNIKGE